MGKKKAVNRCDRTYIQQSADNIYYILYDSVSRDDGYIMMSVHISIYYIVR